MSTQILYEPLNGGLVTSKDPALLAPGELTQALNSIYLPWSDYISRLPGQFIEWDTGAGAINGLTNCRFNNGSHYLVALADNKLFTGNAEAGPVMTSAIDWIGSGPLTSVHFDNRYYLLNGQTANKVMLQAGTFRDHGLLPVTTKMESVGSVASAFTGIATGYYEYWCTEVVRLEDGQELESAYNNKAGATQVNVTSLAAAPQFRLPAPVNGLASTNLRFRIYRTEASQHISDSLYPVGVQIQDVPTVDGTGAAITPLIFTDTSTASNTGNKTASSNDAFAYSQQAPATPEPTLTLIGGAASIADGVSAADGVKYVRLTKGASQKVPCQVITLYNFGMATGVSGNIVGMDVQVRARTSTSNVCTLAVTLGRRDGTNHLATIIPSDRGDPIKTSFLAAAGSGAISNLRNDKIGPQLAQIDIPRLVTSTSFADYTFGGSTDDWLPGNAKWVASDLDSNFAVQIAATWSPGVASGTQLDIDFVRIVVYYLAGNDNKPDKKNYDFISVEEGGASLHFAANELPPIASTGAVYEGCLVLNDVSNPGRLNWSVPGHPDYFPTGVYYMHIQIPDNDEITYLGVVNNRLVVGMKGALWRVNYLPNEDDASFSRGRALEVISDRVGILSPTTCCMFTTQDGRQQLAFLDVNGLFATDGYAIYPLAHDIQKTLFNPNIVAVFGSVYDGFVGLINDPYTQTLRTIQRDDSYAGSYASRHIKQTGLKWTGSNTISAPSGSDVHSALVIRRNTGAWLTLYGLANGEIWREDSLDSTIHATMVNNPMSITTRDIYPAGLDGQFILEKVIGYGFDRGQDPAQANAPGYTFTVTPKFMNSADASNVVLSLSAVASAFGLRSIPTGSVACNGVKVKIQPTSATSGGYIDMSTLGLEMTGMQTGDNRA